jgi:predicted DNA-binding protein
VQENDRIQVRLPLDMKAEVERAAREDDRDVSYWVRRAIKEALEKRRKS